MVVKIDAFGYQRGQGGEKLMPGFVAVAGENAIDQAGRNHLPTCCNQIRTRRGQQTRRRHAIQHRNQFYSTLPNGLKPLAANGLLQSIWVTIRPVQAKIQRHCRRGTQH
jgi:hypothetical protein